MRSWRRCVNGRMRPSGRRRMSTSVCMGRPSLVAMAPASISTTIPAGATAMATRAGAHWPKVHDGLGHAPEDGVGPGHIVWLATDQKSNFPRCHTGHAIGNRGIDEAHVVRLTDGVEFLGHLRRNGAGLDNQ